MDKKKFLLVMILPFVTVLFLFFIGLISEYYKKLYMGKAENNQGFSLVPPTTGVRPQLPVDQTYQKLEKKINDLSIKVEDLSVKLAEYEIYESGFENEFLHYTVKPDKNTWKIVDSTDMKRSFVLEHKNFPLRISINEMNQIVFGCPYDDACPKAVYTAEITYRGSSYECRYFREFNGCEIQIDPSPGSAAIKPIYIHLRVIPSRDIIPINEISATLDKYEVISDINGLLKTLEFK
ncbi:hypothetical protein C4561_02805 [candidate division WWE3 bacterium]|jgi:hypothetical protein|uniref:Uncharacterized protein n=1 Tax=candidate division WWE3 bacterium TaxID=2053526 RepID=A0A3A4ZDP8_UNCKA|nr:MAG: hypothetical protein C4561_02805 [candidate division WWE3 bacterium]